MGDHHGATEHHIVPKSRCKTLNIHSKDLRNIFFGWRIEDQHHVSWHLLTDNRTPEEAVEHIIRNYTHECVITHRLLIALCMLYHPARPRAVHSFKEALHKASTVAALILPPTHGKNTQAKQKKMSALSILRYHEKIPMETWLLWVAGTLFPQEKNPKDYYYLHLIKNPIIQALVIECQTGITSKEALNQIGMEGFRFSKAGHQHMAWRYSKRTITAMYQPGTRRHRRAINLM